MPEKPRRILEKSSTVRRRYQRRSKRLEFTASQIERIEREEQREKRAKRLREREEKRIAKRKEKAEKDVKDREERKRLGRADPNAPKLPASQPQLLSFFGKKKEPRELPELQQEDLVAPPGHCAATLTEAASDAETEYEGDPFDDVLAGAVRDDQKAPTKTTDFSVCQKNGPTASKMDATLASRPPNREHVVPPDLSRRAHDSAIGYVGCLGESFEDETSILLQDMDPDYFLHTTEPPCTSSAHTTLSKNKLKSPVTSCDRIRSPYRLKYSSLKHDFPVQARMSPDRPTMMPPPREPDRREKTTREEQPEAIEIYQDPEDDFEDIPSEDLMELDEMVDDYKENWHPNFPRDGRESQQPPEQSITPRRRHEPYNEIQASRDRDALTLLSREAETPSADGSVERVTDPDPSRRNLSPSPSARKRQRLDGPGPSAGESSQQDSEFEDVDMDDLEELMK